MRWTRKIALHACRFVLLFLLPMVISRRRPWKRRGMRVRAWEPHRVPLESWRQGFVTRVRGKPLERWRQGFVTRVRGVPLERRHQGLVTRVQGVPLKRWRQGFVTRVQGIPLKRRHHQGIFFRILVCKHWVIQIPGPKWWLKFAQPFVRRDKKMILVNTALANIERERCNWIRVEALIFYGEAVAQLCSAISL